MKAFWRYTLARFAVFGVCWAVLWSLGWLVFEMSPLSNLLILLAAMLVSAVGLGVPAGRHCATSWR